MISVPSNNEVDRLHAYWRASNYLCAGMLYLRDNVLLRRPLEPAHIKPRILGHWGTCPGLSFTLTHLNRLIREHDLDLMFVCGPGHGAAAVLAHAYLDGHYSERYPECSQDEAGMTHLFRHFSAPHGIGSLHATTARLDPRGGELGYSLSHAFGAAFDNPDLIVAAMVGDGEAETGALAASWQSARFLNPARDGAVLPILHLNGYKIANPACWRASLPRNCRPSSRAWLSPLFRGWRRSARHAPEDGTRAGPVRGGNPGDPGPRAAAADRRGFAGP